MAMTKQFVKTQWNNDREPAITAEQLNRMENGIDDNDTRIVELDKTLQNHTEDIMDVNNELNSQSKAIGELADKKITKFYASSQGETHLADSDNGKIMDMMLFGKSEQDVTTGAQLLGSDTVFVRNTNDVSIPINNPYEVSWTHNTNVPIRGVYLNNVNPILANKQYTISFDARFSDGNSHDMRCVDTDKTCVNGKNSILIKIHEKNSTVSFYTRGIIQKGLSITISNIMLEEGSTTHDFEPYTGGQPSPSPDYPQEIKSVVEPVVKVTNKDETESKSVTLTGIILNAIPVSSGGNVTIDGQKYISDYVDVERAKIVRMVDGSKLDTTQSIIDKTEWLLATPTEESLSEELAEKLKALQTYYSQTNLFITSNQLDGYAIFNYPISLANGWNYVKQQIGDTRDYIYDMDLQMAQSYVNSEYAVALTELEV